MKNSTNIKPNITKQLKNKTVLVTGGAGSIGAVLTKKILEYPVKSVRVLDIDEHALFQLNRSTNDSRLRLLLGSVIDKERIEMAGNNVDIIFHLAAVKNIEISEFNPIETIETNINGSVNIIKMCMKNKPKKFFNISTDKASNPSTLYGTTKQLSERLTSWAGIHTDYTNFTSIRLGNVMETRGNVFEIWNEEFKNGKPLSVTHPHMKRYFFHVNEAVDFILQCLVTAKTGEILVPKMKKYKISQLADKISKKHKVIGLRQGEKMEEVLISEEEMKIAEKKENMWVINYYKHRNKK
jgi:UDP-N-acetylglucosamine 4,6-dehydratase/5-epimerase